MTNLLCWVDIPVQDLPRAMAFYSAVLGAPVTHETGNGFEFGLLPHAGESSSGCLVQEMATNRPSLTGPLIYLNVEARLDAALELVQVHGGLILAEKEEIGPWGFRAIIKDTEGNRIALHSKA